MSKRWLLAVMGSVLLLATACGSTTPASSSSHPNSVTVDITSNIGSLDPSQFCCAEQESVEILTYATLMTYKPGTETLEPYLAQSYTTNPNDTQFTFTLRPNAVFANGQPITAQDVVASIDRFTSCEPTGAAAAYGSYFNMIQGYTDWATKCDSSGMPPSGAKLTGVVALSNNQVQFNLTAPTPYFLYMLTLPATSVIPANTIGAAPQYNLTTKFPMSSGPYMVQSYNGNKDLVLVKNPKWWGASDGFGNASIPKITFNEDISSQLALEQFQKQTNDFYVVPNPVPASEYLTIESTPALKSLYHSYPENGLEYLAFNYTQAPFNTSDSKLLREAINLAINRPQIIKDITNNRAQPANQILAPQIPGFNSSLPQYTYNQAEAKSLVNQWKSANGVSGAIKLTFIYPSDTQDHINLADEVQSELDAIGFNIQLQAYANTAQYFPYQENPKNPWQIGWSDWYQDYPDAQDFVGLLSYANKDGLDVGNYHNPQFETLINQGNTIANQQQRVSDYQQAMQVVYNDYGFAPLFYYWNDGLVQPYFSPSNPNYFLPPVGATWWQYISLKK